MVKRDKLDKKAEPGVFIGYSNTSKAYRIFQPQNGKILVSRDVKFMEDQQWSWEKPIIKQLPEIPQLFDDDVDDIPVRGTRSLFEIYQLSNVAILEPVEFEEAEKDEKLKIPVAQTVFMGIETVIVDKAQAAIDLGVDSANFNFSLIQSPLWLWSSSRRQPSSAPKLS
ncbi:hypothetical protein L6164_003588 [Bauhinia variegata]|uniref:Uncharacterized protein n=1 Tax=Bauhinia variegata TaxID=167791 RepID=A0ACB9Q396_BAUVA|nr:hypothetical protein L6164_003588 [Bauhinia variegata]